MKKLLFDRLRVPHQNVLRSSFRNPKNTLSICRKIVLQIAAKMGLELWRVEIPKSLPKHTMLIGIDVYHKTKLKWNSVAALVATMNDSFSKFYSKIDFHNPGVELLPNL